MSKIQIIVLFVSLTAHVFASDIRIADHGKTLTTKNLVDLQKSAPSRQVRVFEPHEMKEQTYSAIDARSLLTVLYGERWKSADEILFTCADGYQASVPAKRFLDFDGYLAHARENDPSFSVTNKHQNNEHVPLGPLYLIWDNLKAPELKRTGAYNWPYQVVAIDLVSLKDRFPGSYPKSKDKEVVAGFEVFRGKCMSCHKVNGDGGEKGPELNRPVSVTVYWRAEWLEKFLWDPRQVRQGSTMPGLKDTGTMEELASILRYLRAMAARR